MSLLQKYRKEEIRKTSPEEEKGIIQKTQPASQSKPLAPREQKTKKTKTSKSKNFGNRSRPVISATVSLERIEALNELTEEKYLNRSKFIEDALKRTIKVEFPNIANKYNL